MSVLWGGVGGGKMQIGRLKIHFFCCLKDNAPRSMAESFIILNGMLIIIDVVVGFSIEWVEK